MCTLAASRWSGSLQLWWKGCSAQRLARIAGLLCLVVSSDTGGRGEGSCPDPTSALEESGSRVYARSDRGGDTDANTDIGRSLSLEPQRRSGGTSFASRPYLRRTSVVLFLGQLQDSTGSRCDQPSRSSERSQGRELWVAGKGRRLTTRPAEIAITKRATTSGPDMMQQIGTQEAPVTPAPLTAGSTHLHLHLQMPDLTRCSYPRGMTRLNLDITAMSSFPLAIRHPHWLLFRDPAACRAITTPPPPPALRYLHPGTDCMPCCVPP
jgi:hypothetical protein